MPLTADVVAGLKNVKVQYYIGKTERTIGNGFPPATGTFPGNQAPRRRFRLTLPNGAQFSSQASSSPINSDQLIATADEAPFSANADLSGLKSGSYRVKAQLVSEGEIVLDSADSIVTFANKPDDEKQAKIAQEELAAAQAVANASRREEERKARLREQAKLNTRAAIRNNQVSVEITSRLAKVGPQYFVSFRITNRSTAAVGPFIPHIMFDDFSETLLLAYDPLSFDEKSGGITKYYGADEVLVAAQSSREFSFTGQLFRSEQSTSKRPVRIEVSEGLSVPVSP